MGLTGSGRSSGERWPGFVDHGTALGVSGDDDLGIGALLKCLLDERGHQCPTVTASVGIALHPISMKA